MILSWTLTAATKHWKIENRICSMITIYKKILQKKVNQKRKKDTVKFLVIVGPSVVNTLIWIKSIRIKNHIHGSRLHYRSKELCVNIHTVLLPNWNPPPPPPLALSITRHLLREVIMGLSITTLPTSLLHKILFRSPKDPSSKSNYHSP